MTARRVTALLCAAAALTAPVAARADGDPASDVLLFQDAYLPYFPAPSQAEAETLERMLREVKAKGYPMKVALIQTRGDLGAYPDLFGRPADYAELLSGEIAFRVRNPHLLIVMAEGGLAGRNLGAEAEALLADIEIDTEEQSDGLVRAALEAVAAVAGANGHPTEVPEIEADAGPAAEGQSHTALYVISGVIVLLGIALIAVSFLRPGRPARG